MADNPIAFATAMIDMYGARAEEVTREYARKHKTAGQVQDHVLWTEVADIIGSRQKLLKALDA